MSIYRLEVGIISRGKGRSITSSISYICGRTLHDNHNGRTYYNYREDVVWQKIFLPSAAPPHFRELQNLCDEIELAEVRWDARTARQFIGSLPNELSHEELGKLVHEFITSNFVAHNLCAIAAIHSGYNKLDPLKNNPHVHILVSTRTVGPDGFSEKKDREHDKRKYITRWREQWALVQNRAYERNGLDIRVSHESLEVQGVYDRKPVPYISHIDWQKEQRGEHTRAGDERRVIEQQNKKRTMLQRQCEIEVNLSP